MCIRDRFTLRSPDGIFGACGGAPLCAVRTNRNASYFNGGLLVFPPSETTFAQMKHAVVAERERGRRRDDAEQGLLNEWYPAWKPLPRAYNTQGVGGGASWNEETTVFLHEKYWLLPSDVQVRLLPKGEGRARPTLLSHLRSFFKQKTAYEIMPSLVGSEMCIRDRRCDWCALRTAGHRHTRQRCRRGSAA